MQDLPEDLLSIAAPLANGATVLRTGTPLLHLRSLANWALDRGFDLADIDVRRPTLEEVYLSLTTTARGDER